MKRDDSKAIEPIEWHVIARGGDMTARVHRGMCLGEGTSGELSFEPGNGLLELGVEAGQLKLSALRDDQELLVPGERPARAVLVSPQTHVSIEFRGHTLDVDNDFALARPVGSSLEIRLVDSNSSELRQALGPLNAGHHLAGEVERPEDIIVISAERHSPLRTSPEDHLPRSERHRSLPAVPTTPVVLGGALLAVVVVLLAVAVYLPSRLEGEGYEAAVREASTAAAVTSPAAEPPSTQSASTGTSLDMPQQQPAASGSEPTASDQEAVASEVSPAASELSPAASEVSPAASVQESAANDQPPATSVQADAASTAPAGPDEPGSGPSADSAGGRVNDQVLDRVDALISAEQLPDRATIDFMIETLKTLQLAYPNDPRLPEALDALTLRLIDGARQTYDAGNPFQAGRLVELALTTGAARSAVEETAADFATARPPAKSAQPVSAPAETPAVQAPAAPAPSASTPAGDAGDAVKDAQAGPVIADLPAPASASPAAVEAADGEADGLDALVGMATGVAMGALAVESVAEDPSAVRREPPDSADSGTPVAASEPPASPAANVDRLPQDFPLEDAGPVAGSTGQPPPLPAFLPVEQLTVTHREPLEYPGGVLRGVRSLIIEFTVTETGEVRDLVPNGDAPERFVDAALRAIGRWRFEPVLGPEGQPAPVRTAIRVTFRG